MEEEVEGVEARLGEVEMVGEEEVEDEEHLLLKEEDEEEEVGDVEESEIEEDEEVEVGGDLLEETVPLGVLWEKDFWRVEKRSMRLSRPSK